jgi:hypothetical protein
MTKETINCPKCNATIDLTEALQERVEAQANARFTSKIAELKTREAELLTQSAKIARQKEDLDLAIKKKLKEERDAQKEILRNELKAEIGLESEDLKAQLKELSQSADGLRIQELKLRRDLRVAKEKEQNQDLEFERRLDDAKKVITDDAIKKTTLEFQQKETEKEKIIDELKNQLIDMRRKVEQGSQQAQGEANEEIILEEITRCFSNDEISKIPTGNRGGDILQLIKTHTGKTCGSILWELKKTKAWNYGWIKKLKDDVRESGSSIGIIITDAFPKGEKNYCQIEGVWVVSSEVYIGIATAIRNGIVELSFKELAIAGQKDKAALLYEYLTGSAFRRRIEVIVESFTEMKVSLENEKRALQKIWKTREQQIETVLTNTAQMCGEMQGVVGISALSVPSLELPE